MENGSKGGRRAAFTTLALLACLGAAASLAAPEPGLDELIARNTAARGGAAALAAVEAIEVDLHIQEPTFEVDGVYRADRAGRMRIDIHAGGQRVYSEGYDGEHGWQWPQGAEHGKPSSPDGEAALRHGPQLPVHLLGLGEMAARGARVELAGRETLDGVAYHVVEVTLPDGFTVSYYIDPETFLFARSRDFRAFHPDVADEKKWQETRFSDYREVDGVRRAMKSETVELATGKVVGTTLIRAVHTNPTLDPAIFRVP